MKTRLVLLFVVVSGVAFGQRELRRHTANEAKETKPVKATEKPPAESEAEFHVHGHDLDVSANGIPDHQVGEFPNRGNPHEITEQHYRFSFPAKPEASKTTTPVYGMPFGIALNGVVFDPGTAEFWNGDRSSGWNYEALGGAVPLGIDENHAHVQPNGAYHYHGMPTGLLAGLEFVKGAHSPLIGWAADGFPVYALYGYDGKDTSKVIKHTSSYRLKEGDRPKPPKGPGGEYDGAFIQDYEYVEGLGTLDECNGAWTVTPEFPDGTYAYFLTEEWPVVPRAFRGTPVRMRKERGRPPF